MEPIGGIGVRSMNYGQKNVDIGVQAYQFGEELQMLMAGPSPTGNSFTSLLELPANQAMELLHSPGAGDSPTELPLKRHHNMSHRSPPNHPHDCAPAFPSIAALNEGATKYYGISTAAAFGGGGQDSPESSSSANALKVKSEPMDSGSSPNSLPHTSNPTVSSKNEKHTKRKDREKKGKATNKKNNAAANDNSKEGERLPYVHVRARRGQATNSHSLAERARREKINARMKLLQELVPGCSKISGTALVLDEIINHVHSLQRKVEFLSMRLAAVNHRIDFNLDSLFTAGNGSVLESNFPSTVMPFMWPDILMLGNEQECQQQWHLGSLNQPVWTREEGHQNLITSENSLLSYDSPANSVSLHSSQLKMEI